MHRSSQDRPRMRPNAGLEPAATDALVDITVCTVHTRRRHHHLDSHNPTSAATPHPPRRATHANQPSAAVTHRLQGGRPAARSNPGVPRRSRCSRFFARPESLDRGCQSSQPRQAGAVSCIHVCVGRGALRFMRMGDAFCARWRVLHIA